MVMNGAGGGAAARGHQGDVVSYQQQQTPSTITASLLVDTFVVSGGSGGRGKRHRVSINKTSIAWEEENTVNFEERVQLVDVITAEPGEINNGGSGSDGCLWRLFCAKWKKKVVLFPEGPHPLQINAFRLHFVERAALKHRWKVRTLNFNHSDHNVVRQWITSIRDILKGFQNRPRRLVVFVNPFGGKKQAPEIYERKIRPLFELAQIDVQLITTERANHATETLQEIPISKFDGVICVGGDGMFSELLNGLLRRTQMDSGIDFNDTRVKLIRPNLRLGVIPGGSTDAVAFCTSGTNDPVTAALHIILGDSIGLDVCTVHQDNKLIQFSTTLLAYGFFGDMLVESEKHRWMGPKRYDWSGFKKFLQLKAYEGEVAFRCLPPAGSSPLDRRRCRTGCPVCTTALDAIGEYGDTIGWTTIKGKFFGVNNATTTCACTRAKKGISPAAHIGDGCTDLILVEKCSRFNYLRYMLATAMQSGNPFNLSFVKVYRVREFQFRPLSITTTTEIEDENDSVPNTIQEPANVTQSRRSSVWNCDGEIISEPSINVKVHCQLVTIFSRGIEGFPASSLQDDEFHDVATTD